MTDTLFDILIRRKQLLLDELEQISTLLSKLPEARRKSTSKTSQIIDIAKSLIQTRNSYPVSTVEIMREVQAAGIDLGANPAQNLSAVLSKAEELKNIRGEGWILLSTPLHRDLLEEEYSVIRKEEELMEEVA